MTTDEVRRLAKQHLDDWPGHAHSLARAALLLCEVADDAFAFSRLADGPYGVDLENSLKAFAAAKMEGS